MVSSANTHILLGKKEKKDWNNAQSYLAGYEQAACHKIICVEMISGSHLDLFLTGDCSNSNTWLDQ